MQKNSTTVELRPSAGTHAIPTKIPKTSKITLKKNSSTRKAANSGVGMNGHIKPIKLLNASKTPKRQQSNNKDKIKTLELSVPKAPVKNQ